MKAKLFLGILQKLECNDDTEIDVFLDGKGYNIIQIGADPVSGPAKNITIFLSDWFDAERKESIIEVEGVKVKSAEKDLTYTVKEKKGG